MSTKTKSQSTSATTLTTERRRSLPKPHAGFAVFVAPMLELYQSHAGQMRIDGLDPKATLAKVRSYQELAAAEAAAQLALTRIKDQRLEQSSDVWSTILEIYALAHAIARTDPVMRAAIADFERFLKRRVHERATPVDSTPSTH